jgi:hypothetical protein
MAWAFAMICIYVTFTVVGAWIPDIYHSKAMIMKVIDLCPPPALHVPKATAKKFTLPEATATQ